jgi:hypothetical protein
MKYWHYVVAAGALAVSGCSGNTVKETLGLTRNAPDEFRVVSRPPLSVPPQFNLRPPSATDTAPGQVAASAQAESLVTGNANGSLKADTALLPVASGKQGSKPSIGAADSQFLSRAGAGQADPHVRESLVEERYSRMEQQENTPWWDVLGLTGDKKDPMVDAKKEAERIQKNEDAGKAVTEGTTPEIKGRDTGLLGKIFDY